MLDAAGAGDMLSVSPVADILHVISAVLLVALHERPWAAATKPAQPI